MSAALQEILAGPQSVKYGALPKCELPGDDVLLSSFARQLLGIVNDKGIYRRDNVPVFPYFERARLEILEAQTFRSWLEKFLVCFKTKFDEGGDPFDILRTMNKETAEGVLRCIEFWSGLPEIVTVNPVRLPSLAADGTYSLLTPGYDNKSKTLTFEG